MSDRHLPVHPDLDQLRHQAKDLLRAIRRGDPEALAALARHHSSSVRSVEPERARLADAQHVLARSYGVASWPRLVVACRMIDAIRRDDVDAVRALIRRSPRLLHEPASGRPSSWGSPIAYAANLGRTEMIAMLRAEGAEDLEHAFDRAVLQGQIATARQLHAMGARVPRNIAMGPAETLNAEGMAYLVEIGVELCDEHGDRLAPVACLLQTYSRDPAGKHSCLELIARHSVELPDTPMLALHRGRLDLLEAHLRREPQLLARRFSHTEIYPPALGCHTDPTFALDGTPLDGTTLLHCCIDFGDLDLARWVIDRGADVDALAAVDDDGFGGHTPLFGTVVTASGAARTDAFARLLLDGGARTSVRASLRKRLRFSDDESLHEYRDVTPLAWGQRFHDRMFVNEPAMRLIAERSRVSA